MFRKTLFNLILIGLICSTSIAQNIELEDPEHTGIYIIDVYLDIYGREISPESESVVSQPEGEELYRLEIYNTYVTYPDLEHDSNYNGQEFNFDRGLISLYRKENETWISTQNWYPGGEDAYYAFFDAHMGSNLPDTTSGILHTDTTDYYSINGNYPFDNWVNSGTNIYYTGDLYNVVKYQNSHYFEFYDICLINDQHRLLVGEEIGDINGSEPTYQYSASELEIWNWFIYNQINDC